MPLASHVILGWVRLKEVEFHHTGQEGHTDFYDPRYSLSFLNIGDPRELYPIYVQSCTFHHGFSPALGIFGTNNLTIDNNVVHHTVGAGTSAFVFVPLCTITLLWAEILRKI